MAGTEAIQRFDIRGRVHTAGSDALQRALGEAYDTGPRPRCLCREGGVEMYVARHGRFVVKRMPETGSLHHPSCPSYAPEATHSGLGELIGDAVIETEPGQVELRVAFPWTHALLAGTPRSRDETETIGEVAAPRRGMSLRAVAHFLFERAGFNRWTPAMRGKRHQAVVHKYLMEAAEDIVVKGVPLAQRLYVPEAFSEATRSETALRRQAKLAVLQPTQSRLPLALLIGEYKSAEPVASSMRIWIRHMPEVPLWIDRRVWSRIERKFAPVFEARDADTGVKPRQVLVALIRARRELTYEIDSASLMLTSAQWIPVEGVHELALIDALVDQGRRFVKPLRYDAVHVGSFPNALLLDVGSRPVPLHVVSPFQSHAERVAKARALAAAGNEDSPWVWESEQPMPLLPPLTP